VVSFSLRECFFQRVTHSTSMRRLFAISLLAASLLAGRAGAQAEEAGAVLFRNVCSACHGVNGEGREDLKTPSIAALPTWYLTRQVQNFHQGKRGADPAKDPQGAMMAAIAKTLGPDQVAAVAKHVESLPLVPPKQREITGANVTAGRDMFYERCMECHRYNASGEVVFGSPPLVGRQGWYLLAQLQKFKQLHRGAAKGDEHGAKMTQMVNFLEDEQAMKDVVSFILTLNPPIQAGDLFEAAR
jgi:cytochrome c553